MVITLIAFGILYVLTNPLTFYTYVVNKKEI